ncbi:hypothetical protein KDA23_06830 [Candidatus Saccharibacteria bacterium]|nr:hypothetical protein [Candidatus Saccharibacteria bacterium]
MNPQTPNQPGQPNQNFPGVAPQNPAASTPPVPPSPTYQPAPQAASPVSPAFPPQQAANQQYAPIAEPPQAAVMSPAPNPAAAKPPVKTNPNSTQNVLQIAEIRDGIVIMNDGSYRSVVMAKSINFDLMSPQEQEAVEFSYQAFLNSLYYPVQVFVRSQRVDLQPYVDKLDKIRTEHDNMLLALLMEDYITYIGQLSQQTNIMDKKFYIVVPFFPHTDIQKALTQSKNFFSGLGAIFSSKEQHVTINEADLEAAKTELRNRVQSLLSSLMQCGIQALPLDTEELIELYYDTYNPDTATRQQLKGFNGMTTDIVTKGQGMAPQQHLQREMQ